MAMFLVCSFEFVDNLNENLFVLQVIVSDVNLLTFIDISCGAFTHNVGIIVCRTSEER